MPSFFKWILLAAGLLVLVLGIAIWRNHAAKQAGIIGERRVAKALRRYLRRHRGKLWNNAYLPLYKECCEVDHLCFGKFGVAVIETKNVAGTVSGRGETLTHTVGRQVHQMRNPKLQNKTHTDNVAHHLKKAGLGTVPVHSIVVFSNPDVRLDTDAGIPLSQLPAALDRLPDRGCKPAEAYRALRAVRVKSPLKKLLHDKKVAKKQ